MTGRSPPRWRSPPGACRQTCNFPTFTVVQPPAAGTDLSQSEIFHAGVNKADLHQHRQHAGDRLERQRDLVL